MLPASRCSLSGCTSACSSPSPVNDDPIPKQHQDLKRSCSINGTRITKASGERRLRGTSCTPLRRLYSRADLQCVYTPNTNHCVLGDGSYRGETRRICQHAASAASQPKTRCRCANQEPAAELAFPAGSVWAAVQQQCREAR